MAIAVLGMHRSGTSMVTRMLAACGLQVGPSSELLGPSSENPTGYWERRPMVLLNDVVLDRIGLAWDHVPALPPEGWETSAVLDDALVTARELVGAFPADGTWGWKDPRTSITLPFWERAMGEGDDARASVVVCARNPLDVAASLATRGGMSPRHAFALWHAYSERALDLARERTAVVTHYDAYFHDGEAELARVCSAIGLEPTEAVLGAAAAGADGAHRHSARGLADLVRSSAPDETVALYLELLAASGPVMEQVAALDEMVVEQDDEPDDRATTTAWVAQFRRSM
jgi:hypothetical protein